jgi:hypothetical protein
MILMWLGQQISRTTLLKYMNCNMYCFILICDNWKKCWDRKEHDTFQMLTLVMLCETGWTSWDIGRCNCAGCVLGPAELGEGVTGVVWRWGLTFGYAGPILYGPGPSEPGGPRLLLGIWKMKYVYKILTTSNSYFTIETESSTPTTEFNTYETRKPSPF